MPDFPQGMAATVLGRLFQTPFSASLLKKAPVPALQGRGSGLYDCALSEQEYNGNN